MNTFFLCVCVSVLHLLRCLEHLKINKKAPDVQFMEWYVSSCLFLLCFGVMVLVLAGEGERSLITPLRLWDLKCSLRCCIAYVSDPRACSLSLHCTDCS